MDDPDLGAFARLVRLRARDQKPQAQRGREDVLDVQTDQFGPAQRAGEAEQEKSAIAEAGEVGAAGRNQAFDLLGGERRRSPRGLAMGARDTTQGLSDRRVPGIERLLGDPVYPGDGRHTAPQGRQSVTEAGSGEVSPNGLWCVLNLLLLARRNPMPKSPRLWGAFLVMGLLNNVIPFTLIAWGEIRISSGLASILNAMTPIFTVLAAHVLTSDEKLSVSKAAGVGFGFLGVAVLIGPAALSGIGSSDAVGEAACLLAALTYGFAGIYGRRFKGVPPLKVATGQITASTLILIPLAALVDRPWTLTRRSAPVGECSSSRTMRSIDRFW